jgi:hypothetical protein
MIRPFIALSAVLLAVGPTWAGEARPRPRLCPEDLPDGAHLPPQPGCDGRDRAPVKGRGDGFVDLGNGTSVRIGGRATAEYGVRR